MNTQKNFTTVLPKMLIVSLIIVLLVAGVFPVRVAVAQGTIMIVNTSSDASDIPGDGVCDIDSTTTGDQCSLRAAIENANEFGGTYTVYFSEPMTINVGSALPIIQTTVVIDGTSSGGWVELDGGGGAYRGLYIQADLVVVEGLVITNFGSYGIQTSNALVAPASLQNVSIIGNYIGWGPSGGTANTLAGIRVSDVANAIISDNLVRGNGGDGVQVISSPNALVSNNLLSGNSGDGLQISSSSDGTTVTGNYIGTNFAGDTANPNTEHGIRLLDSLDVVIGGPDASDRNLISGNLMDGVFVSGTVTGSSLRGNYIGTSFDGEADLGNGAFGVRVSGGVGLSIGTGSSTGNLISGNNSTGVQIVSSSSNIEVQYNIIGLDVDGDTPLGNSGSGINVDSSTTVTILGNTISNNSANGVRIGDGSTAVNMQMNKIGVGMGGAGNLGNTFNGVLVEDSNDNLIGSTTESQGNIIRYNGGDGVLVTNPESGIYTAYGNAIVGNSIFGNGDLGIDLAGDRSFATDVNDVDDGPNYHQNTVVNLVAQFLENGNLQLTGSLNTDISRPNYYLEFFVNNNCDGLGYGEGLDRISAQNLVLTGATTSFSYEISGDADWVDQYVTATVTYDEITGGLKDTSEFSDCAVVQEATSPGSSGVIVVNSTGDQPDEPTPGCLTAAGTCTLRAAIEYVNSGSEPPYTITFDIPGNSPHVITPASALPPITVPVFINGKPTGYSGAPLVVLDGSAIGVAADGLVVSSANSEVNGLSIVDFSRAGVAVTADNVKVDDNYIGLFWDGDAIFSNSIGIVVSSSGVQITDNLISGNVTGIRLDSSAANMVIDSNIIGLNSSGTEAKGNSTDGIRLNGGSSGNRIQNNVISGNGDDGIEISAGGTGNLIYGNKIGTLGNGISPLGNDGNGINLSGASSTIISSDNIIANNGLNGVFIGSGSSNLITENSIYANSLKGIEISGASTNNGIVAPTMTLALWDPIYIYAEGSLSGLAPSSAYKVDLYTNSIGPQGETFRNSIVVTTNSSGAASFSVAILVSVPDPISGPSTIVTATVTDAGFSTSEFSNGQFVSFTFTPTSTTAAPTNTSAPPASTATATSSGGGGTVNTSTPTITLTPTITFTPTLIPAYATLTQLATQATGEALLTPDFTETATATLVPSSTPQTDTDTPTPTMDIAGTSAAATLTMQSIVGVDDSGGGSDPGDDGSSSPSMILIIFVGLALLLLIIGGGLELMRWLNARD
jgi:CSLREA domain-containing protein